MYVLPPIIIVKYFFLFSFTFLFGEYDAISIVLSDLAIEVNGAYVCLCIYIYLYTHTHTYIYIINMSNNRVVFLNNNRCFYSVAFSTLLRKKFYFEATSPTLATKICLLLEIMTSKMSGF